MNLRILIFFKKFVVCYNFLLEDFCLRIKIVKKIPILQLIFSQKNKQSHFHEKDVVS